jgi:acetyl-CoA acetyltransferase
MRSALIVSTSRTLIGRAYRGAFDDMQRRAVFVVPTMCIAGGMGTAGLLEVT